MKSCPKCKIEKQTSLFSKNKSRKDGFETWCKECKRSYERAYAATEKGRAVKAKSKAKYWKTDKGKAVTARKNAKYDAKNRNKRRAHNAVYRAVNEGRLEKECCEMCDKRNEKSIHAHHDDYAKPLNIRWLCSKHHSQWHVKNGEAKNP